MANHSLKYCGLTRLEDLVCALELGVAFVGFNFFEHSTRFIEPDEAAELWHQAKVRLPNSPTVPVAVVVDTNLERISEIIQEFPQLAVIQCHGHEDINYLQALRSAIGERQLWKTVPVATEADVELAIKLSRGSDMVLFDTRVLESEDPDRPLGGTGRRFDWLLLKTYRSATPFALAGGIKPGMIQAAIKTGAAVIDLCSGIETAPGIKSENLMKEAYAKSL